MWICCSLVSPTYDKHCKLNALNDNSYVHPTMYLPEAILDFYVRVLTYVSTVCLRFIVLWWARWKQRTGCIIDIGSLWLVSRSSSEQLWTLRPAWMTDLCLWLGRGGEWTARTHHYCAASGSKWHHRFTKASPLYRSGIFFGFMLCNARMWKCVVPYYLHKSCYCNISNLTITKWTAACSTLWNGLQTQTTC